MEPIRFRLKSPVIPCVLLVALCFGLTSAVYLSWLNRLILLAGARAADWGSLVAGYLFQAAGISAVILRMKKRPASRPAIAFLSAVLLFMVSSIPALVTNSVPGVILFGWLMNGLCGVLAGFYLWAAALNAPEHRKGLVFGGGYALGTVAVGILALIGNGAVLRGPYALVLYVLLSAVLAVFALRPGLLPAGQADANPAASAADLKKLVWACGVVLLTSLVKNLGYGFPASDIQAGLIPELSRLPYAAGLVAAGLIMDRDRRWGMLCTLSALIVPFLMLGLIGEPVSSTIFWGLDYIFFAFFSVYRVVLFFDLAKQTGRWELAPLGLLAGRIGDAAGSAVNLLLAGHKIALIGVTAALFLPAVFLLFRIHREVYEPEAGAEKEEEKTFEKFCETHDFSNREREIFRMLVEGKTNAVIAEQLFITENTVKFHVRNVLQKAGCKNRSELQQMYAEALHPSQPPKSPARPNLRLHA